MAAKTQFFIFRYKFNAGFSFFQRVGDFLLVISKTGNNAKSCNDYATHDDNPKSFLLR